MQDEIHALKERVTKNEKELTHFRQFEKFQQDQNMRTSHILDAVQGDIAQLRRENKEGSSAFKEMLEDFEKVKTKFEEQLAAKHKKAQFMDRKIHYTKLYRYNYNERAT